MLSLIINKGQYANFIRCLGLIFFLSTFNTHVLARKKNDTQATGAIDAATFEVLMTIQELADQDQYDQAIQKLDTIKNNDKLNSYAKSQMWNFYAYIYATQDKYQQAIDAYNKVIAEPDAPDGLKLTSKYTLAQLYFQLEDYASVISFMEEWLEQISEPTSQAYIMLTQAYYQRKNYDSALKNLLQAINIEKSAGNKVDENWLRIKAAIYFEKNDLENTLKAYQELLQHYPRVSYMKQISGLYGELGNIRKRLTTYDATYIHGGLNTESEILNLAYMYLGQGAPYKAGKIINANMGTKIIKSTSKNVETLANAWAEANEHGQAIPTLEKAANMSAKGILYARLAGVHFDAGDFKEAAEAAKKAHQKGGLKSKGNNQMLLGMSYFNIKEYEPALQAFRLAKQSKKNFSDARKWEQYTLSEIERLRAVELRKFKLAEKTQEALTADENNVEAIGSNLLESQDKKMLRENTNIKKQ